jgi:hypothetical protein
MTSAIVVSLVSLFAAQPKGHSLRAWSVRIQFISSFCSILGYKTLQSLFLAELSAVLN